MSPIYRNGNLQGVNDGEYLPDGGTTGQILAKDSNANKDASWQTTQYAYLYFNSGGSQGGNRFNDWDDMFTAIGEIDGRKLVTFEQSETMPAGSYDMTDVYFGGDYSPGNLTVELADGVVWTAWTRGGLDNGLRISANSTSPIITSDGIFTISGAASIASQDQPFALCDGGGFMMFALNGGGAFSNLNAGILGGFPVFEVDATASFGGISFSGTAPSIEDDVVSGDGTVLRLIQTVVCDPNAGLTQPNLSGSMVDVQFTDSDALLYDPSTSGGVLFSTTVQDAIDELAGLV